MHATVIIIIVISIKQIENENKNMEKRIANIAVNSFSLILMRHKSFTGLMSHHQNGE